MTYKDRVYGESEIDNPLILELIQAPSIQRLKGIDQRGYFEPYFPGTDFSRFEHSLGVYLLLKKYKTSFEEQVAGLIHDVSHSAFSHCIDYVLETGSEKEQSHQDSIFKDFVRKTEIPLILQKHGVDVDYILNETNFPLKEKDLPDICADRIDYSLRTAIVFQEISEKDVNSILDTLSTKNNYWIFNDLESAKNFAQLFFRLNSLYYAGLVTAIMFATVKDYLRYALKNNYVNKDDLYTTDKEVLEKVGKYLERDKELKFLFDKMNNRVEIENNPKDFDINILVKSRAIDPLCKYNGEIKKISEIDKSWGEIVKKESKPKEYFIKFKK